MTVAMDNTAGSFFHTNRDITVPIAVFAIPIAVEIINFSIAVYKDPACIKRNLAKWKNAICQAFQQKPDETLLDFRKRLAKNITLTVLALSVLTAASICPFFILPSAFAIPAALVGIHAVVLGIQFIHKTPDVLKKVKNYLVDSFNQRADETVQSFHARRQKAIIRIVVCSLIFAAGVAAICYGSHIALLLSKATSAWSLVDVLPSQTPVVVFLEYAAVGILHGLLALKHWKAGNREKAIFHLVSALTCFAFPIGYLLEGSHGMRLHHSFIGLVLQLAPWRSVQCFGAMVTLDSSMYFLSDKRGFYTPTLRNGLKFHSYDFMNTVLEKLPFVLLCLTALSLAQKATDALLEPEKKQRKKLPFEGARTKRSDKIIKNSQMKMIKRQELQEQRWKQQRLKERRQLIVA